MAASVPEQPQLLQGLPAVSLVLRARADQHTDSLRPRQLLGSFPEGLRAVVGGQGPPELGLSAVGPAHRWSLSPCTRELFQTPQRSLPHPVSVWLAGLGGVRTIRIAALTQTRALQGGRFGPHDLGRGRVLDRGRGGMRGRGHSCIDSGLRSSSGSTRFIT